MNRQGDQPAGLSRRPARVRLEFAGTARDRSTLLVFAKLKALRINPSPRHATIPSSCAGRFSTRSAGCPIPTKPARSSNRAIPTKRDKLIDRLVDRPEFADFWALKWADLLRNEEKTMGEKGAWVFQRWLRDELARDVPLDAMVRQIVAGLGSTWQNPPSSFHRTNRDPTAAAESVGQVFLGVRLQCARCHNHPFDVWTQDDYYGLAAFFANIARKQPSKVRRDRLDLHEINGDEYIYLSGRAQMVQPRTGAVLQPKMPERADRRSIRRRRRECARAAGGLADAEQSVSSAETWPIASGSTCWAEASSIRSMISASQILRPTLPSSSGDDPIRGRRDAAQALGRLDHEVANSIS